METAQTADYGLRVLLELERNGEQTVSELASGLGIHRAVLQRIVATLHGRALLTRTSDNRYRLGPGLLVLGSGIQHELAGVARLPMLELADDIREVIVLTAVDGDEAEVIARRSGNHGPLRIEAPIGFRHSLAVGATGLAILAFMPQEVGRRLVPPSGWDRLDEIREAGYAVTVGELRDFMIGLAVPVQTSDSGVVGSLAVVVPAVRADGILAALPKLQVVSAKLGDEVDHLHAMRRERELKP